MSQLTSNQLSQYLERIAVLSYFSGPSLSLLKQIQRQHLLHIPFGVIDVHLKERNANRTPIPIDLESIFNKLVTNKREGYCFEHNELLYAVLNKLGFDCERQIGTVIINSQEKPLPNHQVIIVNLSGERFLVDVGFAYRGCLEPLALKQGEIVCDQPGRQHRLVQSEEGQYTLQLKTGEGWLSMYEFEDRGPTDIQTLKEANRRVSTSDKSPFFSRLFVAMNTLKGHLLLMADKLLIKREKDTYSEKIRCPQEFTAALSQYFGVELPDRQVPHFDAKGVLFEYYNDAKSNRLTKRLETSLSHACPSADSVLIGGHLLRSRKP